MVSNCNHGFIFLERSAADHGKTDDEKREVAEKALKEHLPPTLKNLTKLIKKHGKGTNYLIGKVKQNLVPIKLLKAP